MTQRRLEARGVTVREGCEVSGFVRDGGRARAVATPDGEVTADAFVLAAGAWSPQFGRNLGCRLPIQPGKGYSLTTARPARCPAIPLIFEEHRVAVTPMQSGYRLGSMMEFVGFAHLLLGGGRLQPTQGGDIAAHGTEATG